MSEEKQNQKSERALREEAILKFWKENKVFEKSLEKKSPKGEFVFYEGPPTANGRPGIHHVEARSFKDAIPRYKTMQGYYVRRKAGWDTHGLPVELEVEKQLGLKSKKEIEAYGIAKFNEECKKSVWKYVDEWRDLTARMGYWVDLNDPYVTYHNSYIESVWSVIANVEKRKLLYKDYKVVPWCPRCGTALSSHELAQGYADVKDLSVYAKFKITDFSNAYFLAWTTTPWTLPGNVALAVGSEITYVEAKVGEEILVLAKDRLSILPEPYEIVAEHKGSEMVGMSYEPLYPFLKENYKGEGLDRAYKVYAADFINTEDGTGIVHTAVMYGQDDFELGTKIGLPKYHLVDDSGHFTKDTDFLAGKFVKDEETAVEIIKDLAHRNLLFKKEKYEHSYPHCWRCKTPLIYYARDSWYIRMSELRDELVRENAKINWEPDYIKEGRFGEWLREVKDWAISRERYWGTPLPVWQTADGLKRIVVDSLDTLKKYAKKSDNQYFVMRHGESSHNLTWGISTRVDNLDTLTDLGREQVKTTAGELKKKGIDLLVVSPFLRTRDTAELLRQELGLSAEQVVVDERLGEFNVASFEGKTWKEYHDAYPKTKEYYEAKNPGDESYKDVKERMMRVLKDCEGKYKGKKILFITHGGPAWMLTAGARFLALDDMYSMIGRANNAHLDDMKNAEWRELGYVPLPHNSDFELDLHRPYIDEVVLEKDGEEYRRVKEVMDVWMDSGAMPFAQDGGELKYYPADFISEAIDQTRGWFYTLLAVGVLMQRGTPYKNVISLGHLLDKEGKKMSKSVGNVVNPWEMTDKYGIDILRVWMYSINQPGEPKNFDEATVVEVNRKFFNVLDNAYSFYKLYKTGERKISRPNPTHVLDKWILARLNELVDFSTEKLDGYKLLEPVRAIRMFLEDFSTWYLRRSRERIKDGDIEAINTLHFVLTTLSKLIAPFAPFAAEDLYQKLKSESDPESIHLADWPRVEKKIWEIFGKGKNEALEQMEETRRLVSLALEARSRANIKVRQPLLELKIKNASLGEEFLELIRDELNVKKVSIDPSLTEEVSLDTNITPELEEEGRLRDAIRAVQEWRKERNLNPGETAAYEVPAELKELFAKYANEIKKTTNIEF